MSADGKISDAYRSAARFPSPADKAHLEAHIAKADATLFGATTLRAYGTTLPITNPALLDQRQQQNLPLQPAHIVCSATGKLDPTWQFFTQSVPRWLITTLEGLQTWSRYKTNLKSFPVQTTPAESSPAQLSPAQLSPAEPSPADAKTKPFQHTFITESPFNWPTLMKDLRTGTCSLSAETSRPPIQKLLVMGGGELVASLLAENLIDELYLTICPLLIGGQTAPTPVSGRGFTLPNTPQLKLQSTKTKGNEVFLHYTVCPSGAANAG